MRVFKFGGASIKSAERVHNLVQIVQDVPTPLFIVISAMGKTTNQLEELTRTLYPEAGYQGEDFDKLYDQVVSTGELQTSRIISAYLDYAGITNQWLDATQILQTDRTWRQANVDMVTSKRNLDAVMAQKPASVYVTQGFIAGADATYRTPLGREGSDYSAAIFANLLDAESVTLWKDVPGIYDMDPRLNRDAKIYIELTYEAASRIADAGAQIVHPKTFKPLKEKHIPLYIKSFLNPHGKGTVIR